MTSPSFLRYPPRSDQHVDVPLNAFPVLPAVLTPVTRAAFRTRRPEILRRTLPPYPDNIQISYFTIIIYIIVSGPRPPSTQATPSGEKARSDAGDACTTEESPFGFSLQFSRHRSGPHEAPRPESEGSKAPRPASGFQPAGGDRPPLAGLRRTLLLSPFARPADDTLELAPHRRDVTPSV